MSRPPPWRLSRRPKKNASTVLFYFSLSPADRFIKTEFSGTTAVICIIRGSHLYTFNVGDSRAILASEVNDECIVTELTHDHKPSLPEEKARIENAGGRVFSMEYEDGYDGPVRVWLADQDIPGLAMSRSLCDTVAHSVGVISTPEVCVTFTVTSPFFAFSTEL